MRFPCFKAYFLEVTSHWRTFYKIRRHGIEINNHLITFD
jgi:hypothetical protein